MRMDNMARGLNYDEFKEIMLAENFSDDQEDQVLQILEGLTSKEYEETQDLNLRVCDILSSNEPIKTRIATLKLEMVDDCNSEVEELDFESLIDELIEENSNLGECVHCDKRAVTNTLNYGNLCEDCYEDYVGD
jgi:hypothetical protein